MEVRYINQIFTAGVPTTVPIGGRYFRVLGNTNTFTLEVGRSGQFVAKLESATAGDAGRVNDADRPFEALRITTQGTETVLIIVTDGEIWRDSSNLDVSDRGGRLLGIIASITAAVGVQGPRATFGAPVATDLPVLARDMGYSYGTAYKDNTALAASTPGNIIAAVSNVNGYMLGDAQYLGVNATSGYQSMLAKATAPGSVLDGDILALAIAAVSGAANVAARPSRSVVVASGKRLDRIASTIETTVVAFANYTLF